MHGISYISNFSTVFDKLILLSFFMYPFHIFISLKYTDICIASSAFDQFTYSHKNMLKKTWFFAEMRIFDVQYSDETKY